MIERNLIIDYELVRGLPHVVEERVKELIASCDGWQPKGKLTHAMIGEFEILVQCMVKYEQIHKGLFEEFTSETGEVLLRRRNKNES